MLKKILSAEISLNSFACDDIIAQVLLEMWRIPTLNSFTNFIRKKVRTEIKKKTKTTSFSKVELFYTTSKISDFCSVKDKIPVEQKNNVIYKIRCPGCGEDYIGKTDCCFGKRMHEQGNKPEQPMFQHLQKCEEFNHLISLNALPDIDDHNYVIIRKKAHISETIKNNSKVIKTSRDWLELCYLETFLIKKYKSKINHGIKASRELQLSSCT